jgi:hypothetical protein
MKIGFWRNRNRKFWLWRDRASNGVILHQNKNVVEIIPLGLVRLWLSWRSRAHPGHLNFDPPPPPELARFTKIPTAGFGAQSGCALQRQGAPVFLVRFLKNVFGAVLI